MKDEEIIKKAINTINQRKLSSVGFAIEDTANLVVDLCRKAWLKEKQELEENLKNVRSRLVNKYEKEYEAYKKDLIKKICDEFDNLAVNDKWKSNPDDRTWHLHYLKGRVLNLLKGGER